ncbi:putative allergen asp f3 [Phaeomoniella chlamydospora]|uniref:Thioredoxin peroxidase n=1 Tax=Phaeomoniella chlamydospora TaxID=158046 RepID=A0A0G2GCW5_PHACM|nr:putative allergen asp f3 [Phaeomoniella chlamydospora]
MVELKVGDKFPDNVTFTYVPFTEAEAGITVCGFPQPYNASKEWADKKVVIFALPGAFTPTCSATQLPGYIAKEKEIKSKGVDIIAVAAINDAYVMDAWAKANGVKNNDILFLGDEGLNFGKAVGWDLPNGRLARAAMIIDHGKITYHALEPHQQKVTNSGAEAILEQL